MNEYEVLHANGETEYFKCDQIWTEHGVISLLAESKSPNRKYDVVAVYNVDAIISIKKVD